MVAIKFNKTRFKQTKSEKTITIIACVLVALLTIVMLYPFIYMISVSFSSRENVSDVILWPINFTILAYKQIFSWEFTLTGYANSVLYTVVGTAVSLVLTSFVAYPISKKWLPGKGFMMYFLLITMYFSGGLIPQYIVIRRIFNMYDNLAVMVIPGAINTFYAFIMLSFFRGIPSEIEEAAYIDGASEIKIMVKIFVPLCLPIIATIILFYAVNMWNGWFGAFIYLKTPSKFPIQLVLKNLMESFSVDPGQVGSDTPIDPISFNYAMTVAAILPILIFFPFVQKFFEKGMTIGSLKG